MNTFDALIAPWTSERFLQEIYGRASVHVEGRRDRFAQLLPWDALNTILRQHRLEGLHLRLARQGKVLGKETYTRAVPARGGGNALRLDWVEFSRQLQQGATLILDSAENLYEPIGTLAGVLEHRLGDRVRVNMYAGWQTKRGFDTHWDDHDGFILQVAGRKRWRVFEPLVRSPLGPKVGLEIDPGRKPCWEGTMNAGDLLYIPRGWPHDAVPLGEATLHLTFGVYRLTGIDLAEELLQRLRAQALLRDDLPRFASAAEQDEYMRGFESAVTSTLQSLSLPGYLHQMDARARSKGRLSLPWSARPHSQPIADADWLHWLPPRRIVFKEKNGEIAFEALGAKFTFEAIAAPIVQTLAQERSIRFDRLCAAHPLMSNAVDTRAAIQSFLEELISQELVTVSSGELI